MMDLVSLYEKYEEQFRSKLLNQLYELTPTQFEHFTRELLIAYGFVKVTVTQVSNDGGIDGHGLLKVGLARMRWRLNASDGKVMCRDPKLINFEGRFKGSMNKGFSSRHPTLRVEPLGHQSKKEPFRSSCLMVRA